MGFFGWFSFNLLELLEEKKHFTFYGLWNLHLLNYFYYLFVWSFFPIHYLSAFCNYKYFTPSFKKDVPNGVNIRTTILFSARWYHRKKVNQENRLSRYHRKKKKANQENQAGQSTHDWYSNIRALNADAAQYKKAFAEHSENNCRAGPSDLIKTVFFYLPYSKEYCMFSWCGVHVIVCSSVAALTLSGSGQCPGWAQLCFISHNSLTTDTWIQVHMTQKAQGLREGNLWSLYCFQESQSHLAYEGFRSSQNISGAEWVSIRLWDQSTQSMSECKFLWNSYWRTNQSHILDRMDCDCNLDKRH